MLIRDRQGNQALGAESFEHSSLLAGSLDAPLLSIVRPALTSVLRTGQRSQALTLGLALAAAPCAWRESAKSRKNLHQMVLPAMAVQVL